MRPTTCSEIARVATRLAAHAREGLPWAELGAAAGDAVAGAVPYDAICLSMVDPTTGLFTATAKIGMDDSIDDRFSQLEYGADDINQFHSLALTASGVGILETQTNGNPKRSRRFRELLQPAFGVRHEMRSVVRLNGTTWGTCALYRGAGSPPFTDSDALALRSFEKPLADGMRSVVVGSASMRRPIEDAGPAVLIVGTDDRIRQATAAAGRALVDLGGDLGGRLPASIASVVTAARSPVMNRGQPATARAQARSGAWLFLSGAQLTSPFADECEIAVSIRSADAADTRDLLMGAFALTSRERQVTVAVLDGESTAQIAALLQLSPYTVQDHLKAIFAKVGVSSRRELSAVLHGHKPAHSPG